VNNKTTGTEMLDRHTLIKATLLFLGTFALYFATRSPALDEHDSVQFAMGVRDFNMWKDQPHGAGYPLFIFLGWISAKVLGADPNISLHFVSAIGGALFIAAWFLIIRSQFDERLACCVATCLVITPAIWMTATKVLTDSLAAGLISAQILAAIWFSTNRQKLDGLKPSSSSEGGGGTRSMDKNRNKNAALLAASVLGAAAAGTRPQLILVVLVVLVTALWRGHATMKMSILTLSVLIAGCLLWLLPMSYTQWRLNPDVSFWTVYPRLAYHQWHWRLDKPGVYVGAGDWSARYLGTRVLLTLLGWFGLGFGFGKSRFLLAVGSVIVIAGLAFYLSRVRKLGDGDFWRFHVPWALVHTAVIFISFSPAQRYYLIIFPLFLVASLRGFLQMRALWNWSALALPALLLYIVIPLAIDNHRNEPPALRLVRYLEELYPASRRKEVVLLFNKVRRHAEWYAPGFVTFRELPSTHDLPQVVAGAAAVYTDDATVLLPPGWHRVPLAVFTRSPIIYWKHHFVELYLIDRHDR
jgi:hypothetical protein